MIGSIRKWHTNANLLNRGSKLTAPYSKSDCFLASLFPFVVLTVMIGMIVYQTNDEGKTQHLITVKTSEPHFRLSEDYFEHMHTQIAFTISSNPQNGTTSLHQYYSDNGDDWRIYANSEKNVNLTSANGYSETATLRYHPQAVHSGHNQNSGIVLCHDPINENDLSTITLLWNNDSWGSDEMSWTLKENTTLIVSFQLYITMKGAGAFERAWDGNTLEITNIEESSYPTKIPGDGGDSCYGIRVMQNRMVYETLDGFDASNFLTWLASTVGSVYTFMLGIFVCCASLCNRAMPKETVPNRRIVVHNSNDEIINETI